MVVDYRGNELNTGDKVLYTMKSYGTLKEGEIININRGGQLTVKYREDDVVKQGRHSWTNKFHDKIIYPKEQCLKLA